MQTTTIAVPPEATSTGRSPSAYRGWRFSAPERITFVAACPSCGRDCDWEEQRLDTRLHAIVLCRCV